MNSEAFLKFQAEQYEFAHQQINLYSRYLKRDPTFTRATSATIPCLPCNAICTASSVPINDTSVPTAILYCRRNADFGRRGRSPGPY
ncbi:hypothetical protein BGW80DRAFT_1406286 [Lactifluus volemus]|nr:hypothetical protein BGW80DRAFT_1406265 [Lactifluus volemus]KAH9953913.1 hypothetical protein BGW80DRAFT_1406286 [Lactifluus volemus]